MIETVTAETPQTLYGQSKLRFHQALTTLADRLSFSAATGRIFFVYGPYENPHKLIASACRAVIDQHQTKFGQLGLWRDYLHVRDLGAAISRLLMSGLTGPVNLGSGEPVRQSVLIDLIARLSGGGAHLEVGALETAADDIPILFADTARIRSTGWAPQIDHEDGLASTLAWWRERLQRAA
jgi:nucleoside-diphosphate-sugar epimerase